MKGISRAAMVVAIRHCLQRISLVNPTADIVVKTMNHSEIHLYQPRDDRRSVTIGLPDNEHSYWTLHRKPTDGEPYKLSDPHELDDLENRTILSDEEVERVFVFLEESGFLFCEIDLP